VGGKRGNGGGGEAPPRGRTVIEPLKIEIMKVQLGLQGENWDGVWEKGQFGGLSINKRTDKK